MASVYLLVTAIDDQKFVSRLCQDVDELLALPEYLHVLGVSMVVLTTDHYPKTGTTVPPTRKD